MTKPPWGFSPDLATRPPLVRWAFRLWLTSGVLLAALGVISIVTSALDAGWPLGVLAVAVLILAVGLTYISLIRKACRGPQARGIMAALTIVVTVMILVLTIGFQSGPLAVVLVAAVIGLIGTILAYRPSADDWFTGKDSDPAGESLSPAGDGR
ncbi:hypothetical protein GOHSU_14_00190 [Gordonia hirsuta DSM 44140 = NBRC 16056]|uniref:Uncharacterized protein n=1 Tax=Gordonia hirsuta DSM 44140 = NBRC 16056 TaxID=1121927 RepID=L7L9X4_9ACTN|nr:hypothetical protein [Gordonia hirsuta]GAC56852.1 hypothetical protein GOHSU_14_00190 [Gordonia hirsuta DSM 44140 = NBRC 16056]